MLLHDDDDTKLALKSAQKKPKTKYFCIFISEAGIQVLENIDVSENFKSVI